MKTIYAVCLLAFNPITLASESPRVQESGDCDSDSVYVGCERTAPGPLESYEKSMEDLEARQDAAKARIRDAWDRLEQARAEQTGVQAAEAELAAAHDESAEISSKIMKKILANYVRTESASGADRRDREFKEEIQRLRDSVERLREREGR